MQMLVLVVSTAPQAPCVICQSKQVLQPAGVSYSSVQPFQPLLTLFKRGEVTPDGGKTSTLIIKTAKNLTL